MWVTGGKGASQKGDTGGSKAASGIEEQWLDRREWKLEQNLESA